MLQQPFVIFRFLCPPLTAAPRACVFESPTAVALSPALRPRGREGFCTCGAFIDVVPVDGIECDPFFLRFAFCLHCRATRVRL